MANPVYNAVIGQKVEIAPGLIILRLMADGWELPEFKPGQFTILGLNPDAPRIPQAEPEGLLEDKEKMIRRAYSVASSSREKEYIEFYVRLVTSGTLTPRLFALKTGDPLWISPKITGMFTLDKVPQEKNIILFATGTGVAPYMSMLRSNVIIKEKRNYAVVHGALNSWDLGYHSELLTIERLCPNFDYIPIISEPEREPLPWKGYTGFVAKICEQEIIQTKWNMQISPDNTEIFLCGHPMMITGMIEMLSGKGFVERETIHLEKFW
jgi:ferredoxin--NADP+ reductase